ncbi:hypothetical protein [Actinocorallia longicatena]|uniref:Uncharacterized protein n=1 Tax=Actinocorallia longicatena TaxID=111803 RepID=A0ABP6QD11_9ACTN
MDISASTSRAAVTGLLASALAAGVLSAPAAAAAETAPPGSSCKVFVTVTLAERVRLPLSLPGKVGDDGEGCGSLPEGMVTFLVNVVGRIAGGPERVRSFLGRGLVPCSTDRTLGGTGNNIHIAVTCGGGIPS